MTTLDRRTFLRLGAGAAAVALLPRCIRDAINIPAFSKRESLKDVDHIVILIQENRSFNHYFGTMRGVRGFGDRFTIPINGASSVWHQRAGAETILPYHLDSTIGNAHRVAGTPHGFVDAQLAWDGGRYGNWPTHKHQQSMGYYTQQELPFQFALAEAFTICDAYHSSFHGSTNPNRLFAFTGTIDPLGTGGGPFTDNTGEALGDPALGFTYSTYAERLETASISWKVYQDMADNFTDNPLAGFKSFRQAYLTDPESPLIKKGMSTTLQGANLDGLRNDVLAGKLPSVSWIVAPAAYSEHPGPSSPVQGAYYVQQVLEALTAVPEVFSRTVLLVTFDENDGFFDHLPPPCAPSGAGDGTLAGASTVSDSGERHVDGGTGLLENTPYGPGPRVPMWVVSPFSRGGWVCSETFDHTSIIRFLEERFGVMEPNISAYRRAVCGDLRSAFNFSSPNDERLPTLPTHTRFSANMIRYAQEGLSAVPVPVGSAGSLPVQATGTRPSRRLPYALDVRAEVSAAKQTIALTFENTGTAGAVFHVYDKNDLTSVPRRYAVQPERKLVDEWTESAPGSGYDLWVLGPNGFHRHFIGSFDAGAPGARLEAALIYEAPDEHVTVRCENASGNARVFVITPKAYGEAPVSIEVARGNAIDVAFDISASGRWCDFEVTAQGAPEFVRRFAGRMENGTDSVSDPAMGMH